MGRDEKMAAMEAERAAESDAVVDSDSPKRLIVAGPGTGKTFTFAKALSRVTRDGERGVALTFIKNLVADLKNDLGELAYVDTFHGYCKHLMHERVADLRDADLYPFLHEVLAEDLAISEVRTTTRHEIDERLHKLDDGDGVIADAMAVADYYNAVSFPDLVYRVLTHFQANSDAIPEVPLVVVDEYQDFSSLEAAFIDVLATKSPVLIAGDDDQALYSSFRYASPQYIRDIAVSGVYERFELPHCSRCTDVVVGAVKDVLTSAVVNGYLAGRLEKPFKCYLPEKQSDSELHPKLIHVACSTFLQPYAGRYISQEIGKTPAADIAESREKGYPTVLVIGPDPFRSSAFNVVKERFPNVRAKPKQAFSIDVLDAYQRIAANEQSRLGWRLMMRCVPPSGWRGMVKQTLGDGSELVDLLPESYVAEHIDVARHIRRLIRDRELAPEEEERLSSALGRSVSEIAAHLAIELVQDELDVAHEPSDADDPAEPDILFTTMTGAKGLSAEHVFVVGMNNGHVPRNPRAISDEEICSFLVALSRTRKQCHLVSYRWFIRDTIDPTVFLGWIAHDRIERVTVDKDYDFDS